MKSRIVHLIDHTGDGGAQVMVLRFVQKLRGNYDFFLINLGTRGHFSDRFRLVDVPVYELGSLFGRWDPSSAFKLAKVLAGIRPDVVHTHLYKSNILGAIATKFENINHLLHDHMGVYPKSLSKYRHYFPGRFWRKSYLLAYRRALLSSSAVIVLTPEMKAQYLKHFQVEEDKIHVMPNAIDLESFESKSVNHTKNARNKIRQELGLPSDTKIVSMVGRLEPEKDWPTFFGVAAKIEGNIDEPVAFLVVGSGSQEPRLRQYVRRRNLQRIFFLGYRNDIANLLSQSDVFLLTSRSEPFGIVILEAMAAGCPVIATRSGGPESIIANEVTGLLCDVQDVQGLSAQVWRLLRDEKIRGKIISSARMSVEDNYTIDKVSNQMAKIYNRIIAQGSNGFQ